MTELDALFAQYGATMTPEQVAPLLHVKLPTLYDSFRAGRLQAYKVGGSWLIVTQELKDHFVDSRNRYGTSGDLADGPDENPETP